MKNTLKKGISTLLAGLLIVTAVPAFSWLGISLAASNILISASAAEEERSATIDNLTYKYSLKGNSGVRLISVTGKFPENYTIPSSIDGYNVRELGNAFMGTDVVNVTIPEGITSIGIGAFSKCYKLNTVNFNAENCSCETYSSFPPSHPFDSSTLKTIIFGNKVTVIPLSLCAKATQLEKVVFNGKVTKINECAFYACTSLEGIDDKYISNLTEIGNYAFNSTKYRSFVCPERLYSIGDHAFANTPLQKLELSKVKTIGNCAFRSTKIAELTIPQTVEYIGWCSFSSISTLERVTMNSNKAKVDSFAGNPYGTPFSDDGLLTDFVFGENVTAIPDRILAEAKYIVNVEIKAAIKSIGQASFYNCDCLENIYCPAMTEDYWDTNVAPNIKQENGVLNSDEVTYHWKEANGNTLTFNANGGSNAPAAVTANGNITISEQKPVRNGYVFKGWALSSNDTVARYQPGAVYNLNADVTFYAVWEKEASAPSVPETPAPNEDNTDSTDTAVKDTKIKIAGSSNEFSYHSTVTFKAEVTNDAGKEIVWYVNGKEAGKGPEYTAERVEDSFTISCRTQDAAGNTIASEELNITVRNDIISVIIAFILGIFGALPEVYR